MGSYSWFSCEDIEIKDWKGLVDFMKLWKKEFPKSWINTKDYKMLYSKGKTFTFENWNDLKIISYWYNEVVVFLKCVAKYIEGNVEFEFDSKDEAGSVYFEDGEVKFRLGTMDWRDYKAKALFRNKSYVGYKNEEEIKAEEKKLKKLMLIGSL